MSSGQPPRHIRNIPIVSGLYRWNTVRFPSEAWFAVVGDDRSLKFELGNRQFDASAAADAEDRSKQVYVHAASVRRSGLTSLSAGQRVAFELQPARRPGQKDEAASIRILLDEAA
jgi:cold shock CspA family protein